MNCKIIDFHSHAFPNNIEEKAVKNLGEYYSLHISCKGKITDLLNSASEAGISMLVIHATATRPRQVENINTWIYEVMQEHKNVIGFGTVHPEYPYNEDEINWIEEMGLKGIKLHPDFQGFAIDDEKMFPIYEMLEGRLPILFHTGDENYDNSSPEKLSKVLEIFPNLKVVAAHLGGYARWDEARRFLHGKNLYIDTSSSLWRLTPEEATDIIRVHGVDKVLFGTDYPISSHKAELERFMKLPLTEDERERILWKNACDFLEITI